MSIYHHWNYYWDGFRCCFYNNKTGWDQFTAIGLNRLNNIYQSKLIVFFGFSTRKGGLSDISKLSDWFKNHCFVFGVYSFGVTMVC